MLIYKSVIPIVYQWEDENPLLWESKPGFWAWHTNIGINMFWQLVWFMFHIQEIYGTSTYHKKGPWDMLGLDPPKEIMSPLEQKKRLKRLAEKNASGINRTD